MRKIAIITGGSKGIGRAIALRLAPKGWDVAFSYRRDEAGAKAFVEEMAKAGGRALPVQADHTQDGSIDALFDAAAKEFKGADLFVANAAATAFLPLMQLKAHQIDKTLSMVIKSYILGAQRCVPLMEGRNGSILAISGMDTVDTVPFHGLLGAAKAAMEMLTRYLAAELGYNKIRVNAINPGFIDTDSSRFYAKDSFDSIAKAVAGITPSGRIGYPEDVAKLAEFLVSPEADFINGQTLHVDGGLQVAPRLMGR
jgi:enoyl-[acyl-carrier protein] reductase III